MKPKNNPMRAIKLCDDVQLYKYHKRFFEAHKLDDTWCSLFKTKSYLRLEKHKLFIQDIVHNYIIREYHPSEDTRWTIKKVPTLGWILFWREK